MQKSTLDGGNPGLELPIYLSIFFYWHERMWSLCQGVQIWNFEEITKQKKNKKNLSAEFLTKWGVP